MGEHQTITRNLATMRAQAADCLRSAERAETPEQKTLLVGMAQAWLALAEQAERIGDLASTAAETFGDGEPHNAQPPGPHKS
jgi:hypothetical protein